MKLDDRMEVLVAIGSAAAVNCQECLRHLTERATALDVGDQEMAAAVRIGLRVNRAAGDKTTLASADQDVTAGNGCCVPPAERGV